MNDRENTAHENERSKADYLSEIIKGIMASAPDKSTAVENEPTSSAEEQAPAKSAAPTASASKGGGDILSALLSNPELISKLPTLISSVKPILDMMGNRSITDTAHAETVPTQASASPQIQVSTPQSHSSAPSKPDPSDRRAALLCAMKPYLSRDRQQTIDYIIKLSRLGDILKTL